MKNTKTLINKITLTMMISCMVIYTVQSQSITVKSGTSMYVAGTFDSGGYVDNNGTFTMDPNTVWDYTAGNNVNGTLTVNGSLSGNLILPLGETSTDKPLELTLPGVTVLTADYITGDSSALTGDKSSLTTDYSLNITGYWQVVAITGDLASSETNTLGFGSFSDAAGFLTRGILYNQVATAAWGTNSVSAGNTYNLAWGGNSWVLGVGEDVLATFRTFPNPVTDFIRFEVPNSVERLDVDVYNINGAKVKTYTNVDLGQGTMDRPLVASGLYLFRFSFNNGEAVSTQKLFIQ